MELKKYKLGDLAQVTRGASLSGEYYGSSVKCVDACRVERIALT